MPYRLTRVGLCLAALAGISCTSGGSTRWHAANFSPLPTNALAGAPVVVLPLGALEADSGVAGAELGTVGHAQVDSVIYEFLSRRVQSVYWMSSRDSRELARKDGPTPNPDSLPLYLLPHRTMSPVPEPLLSQLRALLPQSRRALSPAQLAYRVGRREKVRAELILYLLDPRAGAVAWNSDVAGEGSTPLAALAAALRMLTPTGQ